MQSSVQKIHEKFEAVKNGCGLRDRAMHDVRLVRNGNIDRLHPDLFADDMPKSIVANLIDVAARDTAELMAPLPALACVAGNMATAEDKKRAAKKNRIGAYYWECSKLALQQIKFADSSNCYSFGTYVIEPDFEKQLPRIRFESPFGAYYYKDRWGNVVWYAKETMTSLGDLIAQYPDKEARLLYERNGTKRSYGTPIRVVRYQDKHEWVVYLPQCDFMVLARVNNPMKRLAVVIAERPDTEDRPRGQYDDAVYPHLARSVLEMAKLKLTQQVVDAPWTIPDDVTEMPFGSDAVWRSQNPEKIRKAPIGVPQDVFAASSELERDAKMGARYPEARSGSSDANIITGRGIQALMGSLDTQVKTMQIVLGEALERATSLCFELDEALWPNLERTIHGVLSGKPFETKYVPSRDIAGAYGTKVTYGFAAGQSPAQAMVTLLQLRGDDQISRNTARRQLPIDIDPEEEQREIDQQQLNDALKQGVAGLLQSIPAMVAQGADPMQAIRAAAKIQDLLARGKPLHVAIEEAMQPEPQPEPEEVAPEGPDLGQQSPPGAPETGPEGQLPPGMGPDGLMSGVPHGQAGKPPGGMPDVASMIASLRGQGEPRMEASIMRKRAVA